VPPAAASTAGRTDPARPSPNLHPDAPSPSSFVCGGLDMGGGDSAVDWSGLLKWSLQYTDGTSPSGALKPLSSSDVAWLNEAFASGVVDQVKSMRGFLKYLSAEVGAPVHTLGEDVASVVSAGESGDATSAVTLEGKLEAAEELRDIVSQIDLANDLPKIGGVPVLLGLLSSPEPSLRAHGCGLWQAVTKDNPSGQVVALSAGALAPLMTLMNDSAHPSVQAHAMGAVSALVQNCPPARAAFCGPAGMGVESLARAVGGRGQPESAVELEDREPAALRVRRRALFFLRTLIESSSESTADVRHPEDGGADPPVDVSGLAAAAGLAASCVELADDPDLQLREDAVAVLRLLASSGSPGRTAVSHPDLGAIHILQGIAERKRTTAAAPGGDDAAEDARRELPALDALLDTLILHGSSSSSSASPPAR